MSELHPADEQYDAGDERQVKQKARSAKARENIRAQVLRNIMASIDGREWMFYLLEICNIHDSNFASDAMLMAFWEGKRHVGMQIMKQLQIVCPEQYLQMMKEVRDRADVRD
jgi:hypothetical protein